MKTLLVVLGENITVFFKIKIFLKNHFSAAADYGSENLIVGNYLNWRYKFLKIRTLEKFVVYNTEQI